MHTKLLDAHPDQMHVQTDQRDADWPEGDAHFWRTDAHVMGPKADKT